MGSGQSAYFTGSGGGLTVTNTTAAGEVQGWTLMPSPSTAVRQRCSKHRLGHLELVGEEVQGTCVGCGERVVVPSLPDASKTLVRVLTFEDRVMALTELSPADRQRAVLNLLPDFADLAQLVAGVTRDMAIVERVMRVLRAQLASLAKPAEDL